MFELNFEEKVGVNQVKRVQGRSILDKGNNMFLGRESQVCSKFGKLEMVCCGSGVEYGIGMVIVRDEFGNVSRSYIMKSFIYRIILYFIV